MKKVLVAFFASLALALTTVGLGSAANAAYPSTVPTAPAAPTTIKPVNEGATAKITIKIKAGNSKIKNGTVRVTFNGKKYTFKVRNGKANIKLKMPKVNKDKKLTIKYEFKPAKGSVYKGSKGKTKIKVKNK